MNPNASIFVPSMRADPAEERVSQIQFITKQIDHTKQELAINNGELVKLHNQLTAQHTQLIEEMQRRESGELPCCTQQQIDELTDDYKQHSAVYYSKYTKFNDKTSELVTLQQKLHRLLLAPLPPSSSTVTSTASNTQQPMAYHAHYALPSQQQQQQQQQQLAQHLSTSHSTTTTVAESEESQSNHNNNMRLSVLDGIDMNYSYSPPPATPHSVLPPIMEADAEYAWIECDENNSQNTNAVSCSLSSTTVSTSLSVTSGKINAKQHCQSGSNVVSHTNTNDKCVAANEAYSDCNKENIDPSSLKHKAAIASKFDFRDAPHRELSTMSISNNSMERPEMKDTHSEESHEKLVNEAKAHLHHLQHQEEHHHQHQQHRNQYNLVEAEIQAMLENMMYCDMETVCGQFHKFVHVVCSTLRSVELLVDVIINHGIENKPEFFGSKYSLLCQSLVAQFDAHSQRAASPGNTEWSKVPRVNLRHLIWKSCFDAFKKLQFGNDGEKFINVMIIIAELLNAELISAQQVFNNVFKLILSDSKSLCENDIEGLYEIFKRCHHVLITPQTKIQLHKYFHIMDEIKNLDKFQTGMQRVPFMVNQMKGFANKADYHPYQAGTAYKRKY